MTIHPIPPDPPDCKLCDDRCIVPVRPGIMDICPQCRARAEIDYQKAEPAQETAE